jgi:hypothetical protein
MKAPRLGSSGLLFFAGFAVLTMLATSCETSTSTGGRPAGLTRPTDAAKAVTDAIARTATFKDVKYNSASTYASGAVNNSGAGVQTATSNPLRIRSVSTNNGKKLETIQDGGKNVYCTMPEGGPNQQFPTTLTPGAADPFGAMTGGLNWRFLADTTLDGHNVWHLISDFDRTVGGTNPNHIVIDVSTREIWIDSQTGKILKRFDHTVGSENGNKYDFTLTLTNFIYNSGVTVPGCP